MEQSLTEAAHHHTRQLMATVQQSEPFHRAPRGVQLERVRSYWWHTKMFNAAIVGADIPRACKDCLGRLTNQCGDLCDLSGCVKVKGCCVGD